MARHWKKPKKKLWIPLAVLVAIFLIVWLFLEVWLTKYVNGVLGDMGSYQGSMRDVDVHLYRGAYQLHDLKIVKKTGKVPDPFVDIRTVDLSIEWGALLRGRIVSNIELDQPVIVFATAKSGTTQTGTGVPWQKKINDLMPIDINVVTLRNGQVHYKDFSASKKVDLDIHQLNGEMRNLRNVYEKNEKLPATIAVTGISIGKGKLDLKGKLNALADPVDADINAKIEQANLKAMNNFAIDVAGFNFEKGDLSIYSNMVANKGALDGYVKILAKDVQVLNFEKDGNPLELIWESLAAIVVEVFSNQSKDQFAMQIPISGRIDKPETSTWTTIVSIVRNAFVQSFSNSIKDELKEDAKANARQRKAQ